MRFACAEHPHHRGVGVCAFCVGEKLALCIRSVTHEDGVSSIRDGRFNISVESSPSESDMVLSCDVEGNREGASSQCDVVQGISSDSLIYFSHDFVANRSDHEKKGRPQSLPAKLALFKRGGYLLRANSRRHNSSPSSFTWETPRPSSSSRSPLKLASVHSPSSPALRLFSVPSAVSSSPLQLPPPISHLPASRSPFSLPPSSSLHLRPTMRPTISSLACSRAHLTLSVEETNRRCGQKVSAAHGMPTKRKVSWISFVLRKLRTFRLKRRVQKLKNVEEEKESAQVDSNRTSFATESDFLRHSHTSNNCTSTGNQGSHSRTNSYNADLPFSAIKENHPQRESCREDNKSMRGYANYYHSSPTLRTSGGLQARHHYKAVSCMQRRDTTELLRFYLPPPSFYSNVYGSCY
ncbi:hypothetical protein GOP47_0022146 [Adiantum capillus-veneris]|uniref:Uncharacterized protein n=1 Tax=Adiantum capillus-veneris TaxID=13818 RepID=A0A9D4UAH6_ADICA|nr:hypothetical protein GOP47_0022146 [Adiantum capillus-veneris]